MFKRPSEAAKAQSRAAALQKHRETLRIKRLEAIIAQQREIIVQQQLALTRATVPSQAPQRRTIAAGTYTNGEMTIVGIDHGNPRPGTVEEKMGDYFPEYRRTTPRGENTLGSRLMDKIESDLVASRESVMQYLANRGA